MTLPKLSRRPLSAHGRDADLSFFAVEFEPKTFEVVMLDQRLLPREITYYRFTTVAEVADAIEKMVIRGAPAIGIAAAYALVISAKNAQGAAESFLRAFDSDARMLNATRPTAVNLAWAISRMAAVAQSIAMLSPADRVERLQHEADAIHIEDVDACRAMGRLGALDVADGSTILTHCNTGSLATGGYGTALGVIRACVEAGKKIRVLADETRPYLQGARLTAWELHMDGIPVEVITDNMAAFFMQKGEVQFCVVGSDRIAANGDVANKIGTYGVAVLAKEHGIPFTVAAPWSTVDLAMPDGSGIPIEERRREEVAFVGGTQIVADGIPCRHPGFDVTPARYIHAVYTERGRFSPKKGEGPAVLES